MFARVFAVCVLIVGVLQAHVPALASDEEISIYVVDAETKSPIDDAQVIVLGGEAATNRVARTDRDGVLALGSLPDGVYRLSVRHAGYLEAQSTFQVAATSGLRLTVSLQRQLRHIGAVQAHRSEVAVQVVRSNVSGGRLSKDLFTALNDLGGVSLASSRLGTPMGASLSGRDPSLTRYSFDGIRIASPFSAASFDPGLVDSIQVDSQRDTIAFLTINPTLTPAYSSTDTIGGFGYRTEKFTAQGTSGRLGYALVTSMRAAESPLDNRIYTDVTGGDYGHRGAVSGQSYFAVLSSPLSSNTTATIRLSRLYATTQPLPAYLIGALPAGVGPDAIARSSAANVSLTVSSALSLGLLAVSLSQGTQAESTSEPRRAIYGTKEPLSSGSTYRAQMLNIDFGLLDRRATHFDLTFQQSHALSNLLARDVQSRNAQDGRDLEASASTVLVQAKSLSVVGRASAAKSVGTPLVAGVSLEPTIRLQKGIQVRIGLGSEVRPSFESSGGAFDDPGSAVYDCATGIVTASGPNDARTTVRSTGADAALHAGRGRWSLDVYGFAKTYNGVILSQALEPAAMASDLPVGYIAALRAGFQGTGRCGASSASGPSQIFIVRDIAGLRVGSRGINLRGRTQLGEHAEIEWFYDANSSVLVKPDPRIGGSQSPYLVGSQLPNVPLHRAGLTIGWQLGDRKTSVIGNEIWTSANNVRNLPPYGQASVGVERRVSPTATLDVVASNLGSGYSGLFTSTRFAVPIPTTGRPLPLFALPLSPPAMFARLVVRLGQQ
jgi:Carboxypeptidase regulatory-like domain/TonB dependent receptor